MLISGVPPKRSFWGTLLLGYHVVDDDDRGGDDDGIVEIVGKLEIDEMAEIVEM